MRIVFASISVVSAWAALFAADLPFWGADNGKGTNVVATASAGSAVAKPVEVRTVSMAETDPIVFSSHPRGLIISIR